MGQQLFAFDTTYGLRVFPRSISIYSGLGTPIHPANPINQAYNLTAGVPLSKFKMSVCRIFFGALLRLQVMSESLPGSNCAAPEMI